MVLMEYAHNSQQAAPLPVTHFIPQDPRKYLAFVLPIYRSIANTAGETEVEGRCG